MASFQKEDVSSNILRKTLCFLEFSHSDSFRFLPALPWRRLEEIDSHWKQRNM